MGDPAGLNSKKLTESSLLRALDFAPEVERFTSAVHQDSWFVKSQA